MLSVRFLRRMTRRVRVSSKRKSLLRVMCRICQFVGIARVVALAITTSCLLMGCGTTSLFRECRAVTLASVQYVPRCDGLSGPEAEREFSAAVAAEIRKRGLLCEGSEAVKIGVWLTVVERIRFTPEGHLYRYDCDAIIASARGEEAPEKLIERNFTVDSRRREYLAVRKVIVDRLGDLVEEAVEKI